MTTKDHFNHWMLEDTLKRDCLPLQNDIIKYFPENSRKDVFNSRLTTHIDDTGGK